MSFRTPYFTLAASGELDPMSHVLPHHLFGSSWFTNHHLMSLVTLGLGIWLLNLAAKRMAVRPNQGAAGYVTRGRFAQIVETFCIFLRDEMTRPLLGHMTDKYIFYIWSTFFFILIGNLLGLIPFGAVFGLILGEHWSHLGGTMTGNLAFTGGLALIALIAIHGIAFKEQGLRYLKHGFPVPLTPLWLSPLLLVVNVLVAFLELVLGPLIKSFALAIRLFANMVAGHLVLGSLIVLMLAAPAIGKGAGLLGAAAFSFLELFVAFLQAYVFTFLMVIFISLGAAHHAEHDEQESGLDEGAMPGDEAKEDFTGTQTVNTHG
jgi:F-type H+-transporting ATPase subunit a